MVGIRFFTTWLVYMVGICVVLVMYHGLVASIVVKASFWMVDPKVVIIIPINYHCRIAIVRLNHKSSRFILVIYIYDMCVYIYGWWYTYPSEKYARQLGWLFPIYGKNVPNHQLDMYNIQCHFVGYLPNTYFRQLCKVRLTCLLMKPTCLLVQPPL